MKANILKVESDFRPITIAITLESQEQLDAFGSLFNYLDVSDYLAEHGMDAENIYSEITRAGGDISKTEDVRKILHTNKK